MHLHFLNQMLSLRANGAGSLARSHGSVRNARGKLISVDGARTHFAQWRRPINVKATKEETDVVQQEEPEQMKQPELRPFEIPDGYHLKVKRFGLGKDSEAHLYRPFKKFGKEDIIETNTKIASFKRPEKMIEIYEYEACPFCRKVREALTTLDLDVRFYPTPRGAPHHRAKAQELGGKQSYPFMVDPNTGRSMYESDDIITYLFKEYGDGNVPLPLKLGPVTAITCSLCTLLRFGRGFSYRRARYPEQPLVFWGYEMSPFSKFVREVLVELELPFTQIYCGRGSAKRQEMKDRIGGFQVPYLEDPNTGVKMFETVDIVKYLEDTYALPDA